MNTEQSGSSEVMKALFMGWLSIYRFPVAETCIDYRSEDIWGFWKPWWVPTICDDLCQLSKATRYSDQFKPGLTLTNIDLFFQLYPKQATGQPMRVILLN